MSDEKPREFYYHACAVCRKMGVTLYAVRRSDGTKIYVCGEHRR